MSTEGKPTYERIYTTLNPMMESIFCKANECQMSGDYVIALRLYEEIIEKDPTNAKVFQGIADVHDHMGNYTEALIWYNKVLDYDPFNAEAWYNKGMTLRKAGNQEEGLNCIRKGITLAMSAPSPRFRVR
jgi:tetratricopeptide (TPR) repeat protein